jgi:hypothetical protein
MVGAEGLGHELTKRNGLRKAKVAVARKLAVIFNIDPPTSSYAIMRRARPYRGENSGPGKDVRGELDT